MKNILIILLMLVTQLSIGQSVEQKALDYLIDNIGELSIKYNKGKYAFNKDTNEIWYLNKVVGSKKDKVNLELGRQETKDDFFKIIHDSKDLYIITNTFEKIGNETSVKFDIYTNYDYHTICFVYFDSNGVPAQLRQVKD